MSRVLRRTDYPVSQDVKKRVFDAADELEYKPNLFSRMLRGDVSIEIGIIVPSINNPFYAAQVAASEEECLARNFIPIICNSIPIQDWKAGIWRCWKKGRQQVYC
ncbi:MAG: hypothetical protein ACLR0U_24525 [Enterocloster clostridioformis]